MGGVPRLVPEPSATAGADVGERERRRAVRSVQATYDAIWSRFRPGDREWSEGSDQRVERFLTEVRATGDELVGRLVLDAGCGPGTLTRAITRYGCDSVGLDVSASVVRAHAAMSPAERARTQFVQGDLVDHPFADGRFDVVYAGGVLHLDPDPERAFRSLCRPLRTGGTMFVWVYRHVPGRGHAARQVLRDLFGRFPERVRVVLVTLWLPQAMLRQYVRTVLGRNDERDRLRWRERLVHLLDHYTPRIRWELDPDDVRGWFEAAGFRDIDVHDGGDGALGFGVTARLGDP